MSNIYISEPPTEGKVVLHTTVGDFELELWSKEAPKAARNFVQLCLEGYYDKTPFHRVVKDFIVQGGDPTGTGEGGESIYGQPFKTEIHSRLRFNRRGLVGMVCPEPDSNRSQFFFTLAATPELDKKHTIFAKVVGDTIYNLPKLGECITDHEERPENLHYVNTTEVINNPFPDIHPRQKINHEDSTEDDRQTQSKARATKNIALLSFGEEMLEDEEDLSAWKETAAKGKGKSVHDLLDDPQFSKDPTIEELDPSLDESAPSQLDIIRTKLQLGKESITDKDKVIHVTLAEEEAQKRNEKLQKRDELKLESERLRNEIMRSKYRSQLEDLQMEKDLNKEKSRWEQRLNTDNDLLNEIRREQVKYRVGQKDTDDLAEEELDKKLVDEISVMKEGTNKFKRQTKDEADEEMKTMTYLQRFRSRLHNLVSKPEKVDQPEEEGFDGLTEKLEVPEEVEVKVLDVNVFDPERYPLDDPRNPINVRKRKADKKDKRKDKKTRRH